MEQPGAGAGCPFPAVRRSASELEANLRLQVAQVLRAGNRPEARIVRQQPRRVDHRADCAWCERGVPLLCDVLGIAYRQIGRTVQLQLRLTGVVDDDVERIEHVEPELQAPAAAEPDAPLEREVDRLVR